jgi:hypothetical protein
MIKRTKRKDHEPPYATARLGWRYHHLGIPTKRPHPQEQYLPHLQIHVRGFRTSPFGVEWMRFDDDCPFCEIVRTVPHVAFAVDDLDKELRECGLKVLCPPGSPSGGVRAAMVVHDGAPIELIEFRRGSKKRNRFAVRRSQFDVKKKKKN